ncbi:MAG: DNA-binding response regulator [Citrobacter freundii]|nr:MAG: DNA-binding response regulator [Citrobacter freundii]
MLNAIIIDDESSSRNALRQKLADHCKSIYIIDECEDAETGIKSIEENKPDLVFLDVEMPRVNGFVMLQQLQNRDFEVIFITAYDHYAVKAIRFSALDYLVKPVEVEELKGAVAKAEQKRVKTNTNEQLELLLQNLRSEKKEKQRIAIPSMEGLQFVKITDIIYLEASSNYTVIYKEPDSKLIVSRTLKDFEELLPTDFVRIHHAHIINCNAVEKYIKGDGGQVVMKNGAVLDVSKRKKMEFLKMMYKE